MDNMFIVLAQAKAADTPSVVDAMPVGEEETSTVIVASDPNAGARPMRKPGGYCNMIILGLMFVVMYFLLFRGPRKKQQRHSKMVQSLQKNDRIRTIGGIIGTVVDIKDDEITLKVDESNNTKIKIASSAIGKNLLNEKN